MGFGNEATSAILDPPLTTVMQYLYDMGKIAAHLFLEQLNTEPELYVPQTKVLATQLIINKSSLRQSG